MATLDQFQGCLLGLSLGDALGAPFEGGIVERLVWRAIGVTKRGETRWTDDTQMTVDLVESFLAQCHVDPDDLALRFAKSHQPFLDMRAFIAQVGGDVDTIGAMAGAIWGATNGYAKLPAGPLSKLEQRDKLENLAATLHRHVTETPSSLSP